MVTKRTLGEKIFNYFNITILFLLSIVCVYPLLYVLFASISDPYRLIQHQGILFAPLGFSLKAYGLVFNNPNIITGYINTIFYVVVGTSISLLLTCFGAYGLSRKNIRFTKYIMMLITFTMFFNGGLIPLFLVVQKLGINNTRWIILLITAISTWNLIIMRTSFANIPVSLEESAKIDGAHDFTILFKIIIPLSKSVMAVIILFYAVGMWNSWFFASIFLRTRSMYPLQIILREILVSNNTSSMVQGSGFDVSQQNAYRMLVKYSTIIIATVPILTVYPFLQRYFIKGIMIGSIKQ